MQHTSTTSRRTLLTRLLGVIAILALAAATLPTGTALAASASLQLTLRTSFPVVNSGDWSIINLDYRCASITNTPCQDVVVSTVLPAELSWAAGDVQVLGAGTTPTYSAATHTATWAFTSPIAAGDAGTIELRVKFPAGTTPNGTVANVRASISASNAPTALSNTIQITALAQPRATADKSFASGGALDVPTTYNLSVCIPSGGSGALNLSNILITDTIPAGATFVSASNGGTYNPGPGTVTWPAAAITIGSGSLCVNRSVTVMFTNPPFTVGTQVRNDMTVTATALGGATLNLSDFDVRPIQPPIPGMSFSKSGPSSALVGDTVRYNFSVANTGTTPLDSVTIVDDPIPAQLRVTRVYAGAHNLPATLRLQIEYQTNTNATWTALPGAPFTAAACVNVAPTAGGGCATSVNLAGSSITALRYTYLDPLPFGFQSTATRSGFEGTVVSTPVNQILVNQADGSFTYNGVTSTSTGEARTRVIPPGSRPSVSKAVSPAIVNAGDAVTYTLTLRNDVVGGSGAALVDPMLADLLASQLTFVPGSPAVVSKPAGAPDPVFELLPNYNGTGQTLLRWRWDSYSLPTGEQLVVSFRARIAPYTPAGTITNSAALVRWDNPAGEIFLDGCQSQPADSNDLDGDGNTSEAICNSTISSVSLAASARTSSLKLVRGQLDTGWTRDPLTGLTTPGGMADYQLVITNTDTVALTQLVVVDILPWVGDSGVVRFDQARGSAWRPYLVGPISAPAGATVFYSTETNPCRQPDLGLSPDSTACTGPAWSTSPPADITTVQSVKIEFGSFILQPQSSVLIGFPMRAPVGGTPGEIAWNSFGYRAREVTSGDYLLASEPPRVGIERTAVLPPSYGNYIWLDQDLDGVQDAGEPGVNGARIDLYRDTDGTAGPSAGDAWVGYTLSGPDDAGNPGYYLFSSPPTMPAGDYYARIQAPPGYALTLQNSGADDTVDSDASQATGYTAVTHLDLGEDDPTWDAGLTASTAVGNYVWLDRNADGVQDEAAGDGLNGVTVQLFRSNGTPVGTTTTADDFLGRPGYYLFSGLTAGDYYVQFTAPPGFALTTPDLGGDDARDSDAALATGRTPTFTLANNQIDLSRDAGLTLAGGTLALGDRVWRDLDGDGRYEPAAGEPGVDGVRLNLYRDANGNSAPDAGEYVGSTTTYTSLGVPGAYQFTGLAAGSYIVEVDQSNFGAGGALAGLRTSTGNDPAPDPDTDVDSDDNGSAAGAAVRSLPVTLSVGGEPGPAVDGDGTSANQTVDFGFVSGAALGDKVWFDTNSDDVQQAGEPGVPGVTVQLLDDATGAVLATTTTDALGSYGFTQLAAGTYRVRFSNFPAGYTLVSPGQGGDPARDSDAAQATGETPTITLASGQTDLTWDAGLAAVLAGIGDFVWDDANRNGVQDSGELGVPGVTATLYDSFGNPFDADPTTPGVQSTDVTDASGVYLFNGLPPGTYTVRFSNLPAGYTLSPQHQGADTTADSDADVATGRTQAVTLAPGDEYMDLDAGIFTYASIGDLVWRDGNNNGVQDGGEPGVSGVTVRLFRPGDSAPIATTTTNGSGIYRFTNLIPGQYYVEFGLPAGYRASAADQGADDTKDSDADPLTRQTPVVTLAAGDNDLRWDFGIFPTASIGDRAWLDLDADGVQDPAETAGVPGVQVVLRDGGGAVLNTTVTDASGAYSFANLIPGTYSLQFIPPPSYLLSPQNAAAATAATDSDAAPVTFVTAPTTLAAGQNDPTWDIGLYQPSSLGDRVWHDLNGDGAQDPGEPGIAGVTVRLLDSGGAQLATTATDASGSYQFSNLAPGQYIVEFGATPQSTVSAPNAAGATPETDSDANTATRRTPLITLPSSTSDLTWDMGVYDPASLGDRLWLDTNVDGIQDAGETTNPGSVLTGVTVQLWRPGDSAPLRTTTTDATGFYGFTNLQPGDYYVRFFAPAGYGFTRQAQGADRAADSDVSPISGQTPVFSLASGANDLRWDAGIYQPASVGDYVWQDDDADGVQDAGETTGVPGVLVELLQGGSVVDYTYTDIDGRYLFSGLLPGQYQVRFGQIPAGYLVSPKGAAAGTPATDSDADAASSMTTAAVTLASGDADLDLDLGLYQLASIGDHVWHDQDADGVQDAGEPPIANVTVTLLDAGGATVATTTTNASGDYAFTGLTPGQYQVRFTMPAGYDRTSPKNAAAATATTDSDADTATLTTALTSLTSGENDPSWDAGFYQTAKLGDRVWLDANGNGVQDGGETGVANVTVTLLDAGGATVGTTTTDASGNYLFSNLDPAQYQVRFTLPGGYAFTSRDILASEVAGATDANDSDASTATGTTILTTLVSGEDDRTWDAGLVVPATLGDTVWEDRNGDGLQNEAAPSGVQNVAVTLTGAGRDRTFGTADDTTAPATTDANGNYLYTGLQPGLYRVSFALPAGYAFTTRDVGADDSVDSDVAAGKTTPATTADITLTSGQDDRRWDAGIYQLLTLGNQVWNDLNDNRTLDAGESGIQNVTVQLYVDTNNNNAWDAGDASVTTATTNASGVYQFTGLTQGNYVVVVPASNFTGAGALRQFRSSDAGNATDTAPDPDTAAVDGDDNGIGASGGAAPTARVPSQAVTLTAAGEPDTAVDGDGTSGNQTVDFGFYSVTLGNRVWNDANNNGVLDGGETGVNGATVKLFYDANANDVIDAGESASVATVTTSNGGHYLFGGLRDTGHYLVELTLPGGYVTSTGTNGSATGPYEAAPSAELNATDSDDNGTSATSTTVRTAVVTLTAGGEPAGETDTTLPTGVVNPAADGSSNLTVDFGIFQAASLGNQAWYDLNGDGLQNEALPANGVSGISVALMTPGANGTPGDGDDVTVATAATDASGVYGFSNLIPGTYYLSFSGVPAGYTVTKPNVGANDAIDSDQDPATGRTATVALAAGVSDTSWDLGIYHLLTLGDTVWDDVNNSGTIDGGESGVDGVAVQLYADTNTSGAFDAGDTLVATTATSGGGRYQFAGLTQGDYIVVIPAGELGAGRPLAGFISSTGTNGSATGTYEAAPDPDGNINSDDNGSSALGGAVASRAVTLTPSAEPTNDGDSDANTNLSVDFGFFRPLALGNLVWDDANNSGSRDAGEAGVDGVTVQLFRDANANSAADAGELVATTTTAGGGVYGFSNLIAGDYIVVVPASQFSGAGALNGYATSTGKSGFAAGPFEPAPDPDSDVDGDDSGTAGGGAVASLPVTLSRAGEPDTAVDGDGTDANQTVDFGFFRPASIGNFVWHDQDGDGVQDVGEPGIPGATVTLLDSGGATVATATTDGAGAYSFTGLGAGDYALQFALPAGYDKASPTGAGTAATDSDPDRATLRTTTTTLTPGESDQTWDAGFYKLASIGDFVWSDVNANGVQDSGEPGIPGVSVTLLDAGGATVGTTTTSGSGGYSFTGLNPGQYKVQFALPAGYDKASPTGAGTASTDSDADTATLTTALTTLDSGENDPTWDAGFYTLASIGDFVWHDVDADGVQDVGEPGIPGATVTLLDAGGATVGTTTTSGVGAYSFTGLTPGQYKVQFTLPAGYDKASPTGAGTAATDSDADTATLTTALTTLDSGESDPTWDAGFYTLASIGDFVWHDQNANGVQDAGEPGIPGATVTLKTPGANGTPGDADDTTVGTTTTDASGGYSFTGLGVGSYYVQFTLPAGYDKASPTGAGTATTDSDADRTTLRTPVTTLTSGESDPTWDVGFYTFAKLGDTVWLDADGDGVQGAGETGVQGVTVTLLDAGGATVATTTTDASGSYLFSNLDPAQYQVQFTLPSGHAFTSADVVAAEVAAATDANDSDADTVTGKTILTTLVSGEDDRSWDAGLVVPASIGDTVWEDRNGDGVQNEAAPSGVAGVPVTLAGAGRDRTFGTADDTTAPATTDASGNYLFTGLQPGPYRVTFGALPAGYTLTPRDQGADDAKDSDADPATGQAAATTLVSGEDDRTWDAGIYQLLSLGNRVWEDRNNSGALDAGEAGIDGVTVNLYLDADGSGALAGAETTPVATTTTSNGGAYLFTGLAQGSYLVEVLPPAGYASSTGKNGFAVGPNEPAPDPDSSQADSDDNGSAAGAAVRTSLFTLAPGAAPLAEPDATLPTAATDPARDENGNRTVDVGLYRPASLGDLVWQDADGDGAQDAGEPGIPGVTVQLWAAGGSSPLATTTTAGDGSYSFLDLAAGDYQVVFVLPTGYLFTQANQGADTADSDADVATGRTATITLTPGQSDQTWDAGMAFISSVGDHVWHDVNANGVQDAGEPGIPGVAVALYSAGADHLPGGGDDTLVGTTATDGTGFYGFVNLPAGEYYLVFTPPAGYDISPKDQGGSDLADSDADPATGQTDVTQLAFNEVDPSWDLGLFRRVSVGDLVWNDRNNNGRVDAGEQPFGGVTVELYRDANADGTPDPAELTATATTQPDGSYLFAKLLPGSYIVVLPASNFAAGTPLAGYRSSTGAPGTNWVATGPFEPVANANGDVDRVDHGSEAAGAVASGAVVLTSGGEPTTDGDADADTNRTVDFGLYLPASLGSVVWVDLDHDGQRDPAEQGVAGVTVQLFDTAGNLLATTTTDSTGLYSFVNLPPGGYSVGFVLPTGYWFTPVDRGDDGTDSDADPLTGRTGVRTLVPGRNDPTIFAGLSNLSPTAVTLKSLSAARTEGGVELRWSTSVELGTWGYAVYRSADGTRAGAVRVTPELIAAEGRGGEGAEYRWVDAGAQPGVRYQYWLVEVDLGGGTAEYGPVSAAEPAPQGGGYQVSLPLVTR